MGRMEWYFSYQDQQWQEWKEKTVSLGGVGRLCGSMGEAPFSMEVPWLLFSSVQD